MRYKLRSKYSDKEVKRIPASAGRSVFLLIIIVIELMVFSAVLATFSIEEKVKRCTLETNAYCIDVKTSFRTTYNKKKKAVYYPVFRYRVNENTYEGADDISTENKDEYVVGKSYKIYVDPDDPSEFVTNNSPKSIGTAKWVFAGISGVMGVIIILPFIPLIRKRRRQNESGEYDDLSGDYYGTDDEYDDYR
jgi:hypothetical protein